MITPLFGGRDEDLDLTRTGMVMGTPYYMSPEQARGDRNLDARVDLYACGVILYEALTGRRPFTAANYNALLLQILSAKPKPARDLRPALPNGFDAVLDKAMARNRDDRYRSAAEFQRDLQTLRDRHTRGPAGGHRRSDPRVWPSRKAAPQPGPRARADASDSARRPGPASRRRARWRSPSRSRSDTPLSGENMPVDATEMERAPDRRQHPTPSDASEFEEYPTQVQASPFDEVRQDDAQTTTKRGPEFARQLAQARGGVRDTDVTGRPAVSDTDPTGRTVRPVVSDTDATGKNYAIQLSRRPASEPRDDQETIIKSRSSLPLPLPKRKAARKAAEPGRHHQGRLGGPSMEGDPTQLMTPRAPKAPRR